MSFRFKLAIHFEFSDYFVGKVSRVFIQESVISVLKKMFLRENTVENSFQFSPASSTLSYDSGIYLINLNFGIFPTILTFVRDSPSQETKVF